MKANVLKLFLGLCLTTIQLTSFSAMAKGGSMVGGGGDASEARVDEIRTDILKWINKGGAKALRLPNDLTYAEYESKMTEILQPKKVIINFVEKDDEVNDELKVTVNGMPKTCRGFISNVDFKPHILCNISRFATTTESEQYKLIHHEFSGLVFVENNDGAASDYQVSSQITSFLTRQVVLKLAVKKINQDLDESSDLALTYEGVGGQITITNDGALVNGKFSAWNNKADKRLVFVKNWVNGVKVTTNCIEIEKKVGVTTVAVNKYWTQTAKFCPSYITYTYAVWAGVTFIPVINSKSTKNIEKNDLDGIKKLVNIMASEYIEDL